MADLKLQIEELQKSEKLDTEQILEFDANLGNICKICHCGSEESGMPLITPCLCAGSIKFVHQGPD